jgi:TM2 domain-containing membrane protein YozV
LLAEGDHYRAIGEYKRFLFLAPERPEASAVRFRIGLAYLRGGQPRAAEDAFAEFSEALPQPLRAEAELQRAYARYLAEDWSAAGGALDTWMVLFAPDAPGPDRARAAYLMGWVALERGNPKAARAAWEAEAFPGQARLVASAKAIEELPYRSPLLAGLLSIVPGAGHLYIGQPGIAAAALAWNGLFAFGLYSSIHARQAGVAAVLGLFEALWYAGTIFGAIDGAQKFNRDARLNALDALRAQYDDRPESWPPAPPQG